MTHPTGKCGYCGWQRPLDLRGYCHACRSSGAEREAHGLAIKAGLERARRSGKQFGRPRRKWSKRQLEIIKAMLTLGESTRKIARVLEVPKSSLFALLREQEMMSC